MISRLYSPLLHGQNAAKTPHKYFMLLHKLTHTLHNT